MCSILPLINAHSFIYICRLKKRIRFAMPDRPLSEIHQNNGEEEQDNNERNHPDTIENEAEENSRNDDVVILI